MGDRAVIANAGNLSKPWPKGKSGNPGGRPAGYAEVRSLAREHTELAIKTLVAVCRNTDASPSAKVAAAVSLLDRGWGRPEARDALTEATDDALRREVHRRAILESELARAGGQLAPGPGASDGEAH